MLKLGRMRVPRRGQVSTETGGNMQKHRNFIYFVLFI